MDRRVKILLSFLLFFSLPFLFGFARKDGGFANNNLHIEGFSSLDAEDILSDFEGILPEGFSSLSDPEELSSAISLGSVLSSLGDALEASLGAAVSFFLLALGAAVLLSLLSVGGSESAIVRLPIFFAAVFPLWRSVYSLSLSAEDTLSSLADFFVGASGALSALSLSSGAAASASVQATGLSLTVALFGGGGERLLFGLFSAVLAASLLASAVGGRCESVARAARSVFNYFLGIVTAALLGLLSLQTVVATASDSAALRAARYAASGMIPVVGSTVSGALSTIASGLSYVGGVVGGASVLVIALTALSAGVPLLLMRLSLSVVILFLEVTDSSLGARVFGGLRGALDCLIAVYFLGCIVYIFEIALFTKGISGLV